MQPLIDAARTAVGSIKADHINEVGHILFWGVGGYLVFQPVLCMHVLPACANYVFTTSCTLACMHHHSPWARCTVRLCTYGQPLHSRLDRSLRSR